MSNSQILDVAIGMIFIYLLLSLMCSAANAAPAVRVAAPAASPNQLVALRNALQTFPYPEVRNAYNMS